MTRKISFYHCLAMLLLLGGCASLPPLPLEPEHQSIPPAVPQHANSVYAIGPRDVLSITVYDHADLSRRVTVSLEGSFAYPLLGEVQAAGLTVRQLEKLLTERLAAYLVAPQVSVIEEQIQSRQVYVMGEVKEPRPYALWRPSTLLEMLREAKGLTADAGFEVIVMRTSTRENGQEGREDQDRPGLIRADLSKLLAGDMTQNTEIINGDTIYVPKAPFFYVYGEIQNPGRYRLEPDTTVAKALSVAGGMTRFATRTRLKIERMIDGQRQEFRVRMTDRLRADDILIVPESFF